MDQQLSDAKQELQEVQMELEFLSESLMDRVLQLEDLGWHRLEGMDTSQGGGLTIQALQEISEKLRELTASHPLFARGAQLRNAYIFGRGMSFVNTDKPRFQKILNEPHNESMVFSVEGFELANSALFNDGIYILLRNRSTNRFVALPLKQLTGVITNPDDAMDIWYVQRSWSANGKAYEKWYATARHKGAKSTVVLADGTTAPVSKDYVAYIKHANRQIGWTLGVPDSLPALVWSLAYSGYLNDNAKLVHALSKFAWKATNTTSKGTHNVATKMLNAGEGTVGAGVSTTGDFNSVGVPSAQVNFNNGQPLAAMVAASFGVPVIALLSSPGATGGSYGAAQTLDAPTLKGFEVLQNSWATFYEEILEDIGATDAYVAFPAIETDAVYRQISAIAQTVELGVIWRDEARDAVIDLLDVPVKHDGLPPLPEEEGTVVSGQGKPARVPGGATSNPGGDTDHELDADRE